MKRLGLYISLVFSGAVALIVMGAYIPTPVPYALQGNRYIPFNWQTETHLWDDFIRRPSGNVAGNLGWVLVSTASGTAADATAVANRPGLLQLQTSSTTNGAEVAYLGIASMFTSGGVMTNTIVCAIDTLSTAGDEFVARAGFGDNTVGAASVDMIAVIYDRLNWGPNWALVTGNNSTYTTNDTGLTVAAGTFVTFQIVVDAAGNNVYCYTNTIAGALPVVAVTNTTNIPKIAGRAFGPLHSILKLNAGTNSRTITFDWWDFSQYFTSTR